MAAFKRSFRIAPTWEAASPRLPFYPAGPLVVKKQGCCVPPHLTGLNCKPAGIEEKVLHSSLPHFVLSGVEFPSVERI